MKRIVLSILLVFSCFIGAFSAMAQTTNKPDFKKILQTIDIRSNFPSADFSARLQMSSVEPGKADDQRSVQMFRRDKENKFLMLILKPDSELGQGYLQLEDNLWFYDPQSRKFTHSSMKENFQGTDAKNSDFGASSLAEDYTVDAYTEGKLGTYDVWILDLRAVHEEVTYAAKKVWITKKDGLLLKSEDYSLTKRLLRTAYYSSYAMIGKSFVADKMTYVDALVQGKKTTISISDISIQDIPDTVFTKAYVERVNR